MLYNWKIVQNIWECLSTTPHPLRPPAHPHSLLRMIFTIENIHNREWFSLLRILFNSHFWENLFAIFKIWIIFKPEKFGNLNIVQTWEVQEFEYCSNLRSSGIWTIFKIFPRFTIGQPVLNIQNSQQFSTWSGPYSTDSQAFKSSDRLPFFQSGRTRIYFNFVP